MVRVKICGITHADDAEAAIDAGADALGFVLYEKSSRYVEPAVIREIARGLPPFVQRVAVTVNLFREEVESIEHALSVSSPSAALHPELGNTSPDVSNGPALAVAPGIQCAVDVWQLHGHESPEVCDALAPRRVVKALSLRAGADLPLASDYQHVDAFLLDTPSDQHGGTGRTFDWNLAVEFKETTEKPIILSGGLNPENVAEAIEKVQPYAVDVSSGVEAKPGRKDHAKLRDFIQICRSY